MRDIFVGICYCIKSSVVQESFKTIDTTDQFTEHKMTKTDALNANTITVDMDNINFEDELVKSTGNLEVNFIEFAPKIFKQLRKMEGLNDEDMIQSLLPMKNGMSIKQSQGKSGNFFICTDDNKFILKTITSDELDLIRGLLLKKFSKHLKRYPNSLLCRIYGLYKMKLSK
jgi:hypothetical protein